MTFHRTKLERVVEIDLDLNTDERGFFARSWCQKEFEDQDLNPRLVQCNVSFNERQGNAARHPLPGRTLSRGQTGALYQRRDLRRGRRSAAPVANIQGVDRGSSDGEKTEHGYMCPEGCGHGFLTLEDKTEVFYQMSEFYHAECSPRSALGRSCVPNCLAAGSRSDFRAGPSIPGLRRMAMDLLKELDQTDAVRGRPGVAPTSAAELYPICRSITGEGIRRDSGFDQKPHSVANLRGAHGNTGLRLDRPQRVEHSRCLYRGAPTASGSWTFSKCNLHVMNYSVPVHATMSLSGT